MGTLKNMLSALDGELDGIKHTYGRPAGQLRDREQASSEQMKRKLDTMVSSLSALQSENVNITQTTEWEQHPSAKQLDIDDLQNMIGLVAKQSGKLKRIDQEIR